MQETAKSARVFRFGVFEVDAATGELRKRGLRVRLQEQPAQFLLMLLDRAGEVVSREEIRRRLWPPDTFVDFDQGLGAALSKLRQALGDDAETPRYIETIPKRGFRFVAPVERISALPHGAIAVLPIRAIEPPTPEVDREPRQARRHLSALWAVVAVACVLSFVLGWLLHIGRAAPVGPHVTTYTQITYDGDQKTLVGTDGSRLYFDSVSKGHIAQVAVTGGAISTIPVPVPNFAFTQDVSPDGANFLIATNEKGGILDRPQWNVRVPGGSLRPLPDGGNASFSPDGNSVAYQTAEGGLWVAGSDGSIAHKLASGRPFSSPVAPPDASRPFFGRIAWSPDGSVLRFGNGGRLWEISTSGSNLHEVIPGWHLSSNQCCGTWTPDGKLFVFLDTVLGPNQQPQIWALSERGGLLGRPPAEPVRLSTGPMAWGQPVPGRDAKKIFATGKTQRGELLRFDLKARQFQSFLGGISAHMVSFSKDGQFVAYVSFPEDILWKANRDGTNPVQLTEPPIHALGPRWSPDGTQILFMDFTLNATQAYIVAVAGGKPQKLLPEDRESQTDPNWSPDGKEIVFSTGNPFNPNGNVRILDLATHQITAVAGSVGLFSPRWSPNGRFIAALPIRGNGLKIFDLESQQWSDLVQKDSVGYPSWSRESRFIYFLHYAADGGKAVFRIRVSGGPLERIADLNSIHLGGWWSWVGLDPDDAPMVLRDTGSNDIYALTLEQK